MTSMTSIIKSKTINEFIKKLGLFLKDSAESIFNSQVKADILKKDNKNAESHQVVYRKNVIDHSNNPDKKEYDKKDKNFCKILSELKEVSKNLQNESYLLYGSSRTTEDSYSRKNLLTWRLAATNDYVSKLPNFLRCDLQVESSASEKNYRGNISPTPQSSKNIFSKSQFLNSDKNFNKMFSKLEAISDKLEKGSFFTNHMPKVQHLSSILKDYIETLEVGRKANEESVSSLIEQQAPPPALFSTSQSNGKSRRFPTFFSSSFDKVSKIDCHSLHSPSLSSASSSTSLRSL